jgi:hypothetical protein
MLKSELEVGKTYTHRTGASYRSSELVTLESLEPQKARNAQTWAKPSANLVLVSYASRYHGEETTARKTVLIKNLYPEQEYHEEKAHALKMRELRKVWEQQQEEMKELIQKQGQEIANRLGVERIKLERDGSRIKITHIYTLDQIKELLGEKVSE